MNINQHDRDILRRLAERKAGIAALPIQEARGKMWARLNRLEKVKPMVWLNELPKRDFDQMRVKTNDLWGCATAQIFSEVSPEMHWEIALQYEMRWLERFGLNYYGCCEPLHNKLEILKRVPRLRKISVSTWMDMNKAVKEQG